jgi:hypothetical protein
MSTSSSGGGGDRYHRGTSRAKFDIFAEKGLTQASGQNVNFDFTKSLAGAFAKKSLILLLSNKNADGSPKSGSQIRAAREKREEGRLTHEEQKEAFFQKITKKELDTLVTTFRQRQSSLISRSQIQGRRQLILTDR